MYPPKKKRAQSLPRQGAFQKSALYEDSPGVREIAKKRNCGGRRGLREPMRGVDRLESGLFRIMRTHAFFREPAAWRFSIARPALMQQRKISRRFFSLPFPFFEMRLQEGATRPAVERQRTKGRGAPEKILSPGSLRLRLRLSHVQSSSESGRPCSSIRRTNRTFSTTRASASLEQPAPILLGFLGLSDLLCLFVRKAAPGPRSLRHPQQACRAPSYVRHCTWKATFPTKQASGPDLST